ncbi:hypothetical protein EJB05_24026, partial [Eragrostis curvula]
MAAWGNLDDILVARILKYLPCLAHRAVFDPVCRNWLKVARAVPPLPRLPWLLLPSAVAEEPLFFCLGCRTTHRASLPDDVRGARWCGSFQGGGLIIALQQAGGYVLHSLHSGRRILVPEILRTPGPVNDHGMVIHAARAARHQGVYIMAALVGGSIADVINYNGHGLDGFHVLTDDEEVLVYVPERAPDGALTTRLVTYRFPDHETIETQLTREGLWNAACAITRYLVEYAGKLVMVVRTLSPYEWLPAFSFFELVPELAPAQDGVRLASWVPMPAISGILVVGRCCSMSYTTWGIDFDGVYFLDDATSSEDEVTRALEPAATRRYPCSDMGWVSLEGEIRKIFPQRPPSESSRASSGELRG